MTKIQKVDVALTDDLQMAVVEQEAGIGVLVWLGDNPGGGGRRVILRDGEVLCAYTVGHVHGVKMTTDPGYDYRHLYDHVVAAVSRACVQLGITTLRRHNGYFPSVPGIKFELIESENDVIID